MENVRITRTATLARLSVAVACVLTFSVSSVALADIAFQYDEITDPITSAWFSVDFAAMNAHRTVGGGFETNLVHLIDCGSGIGLPDYDLSDDLFGLASPPDDPELNMGPLETRVFTASIDLSFFPALAGGRVGLRALFTDTVDAMFAMDFLSVTIETETETIESFYGWPVGNENNGFGIGLADGEDLPSPLPDSIPIGATGTGFDETISSASILAIPEPASVFLLLLGGVAVWRHRPAR